MATKKKEEPAEVMEVLEITPEMRLQRAAMFGMDSVGRTIYVTGEISEERNANTATSIRLLDETPGPILVMINSPGGCFNTGMAIYDTLRSCRNPIVTVVCGRAYSMGAILLLAGDERLMYPNSDIMIHDGSIHPVADTGMDTKQIENLLRDQTESSDTYQKVVAERTGQALKKVTSLCKEDTFFKAKEALTFGFVDGIINPTKKNLPKRKKR